MNKREENPKVFDQKCSDYLNHMGIDVVDGDNINCPYRPDSDSESFCISGPMYYDHARGEGGNVWQLALQMNNGDKGEACRSLHESAGVPFIADTKIHQQLDDRQRAYDALLNIQRHFGITEQSPANVLDYLKGRHVSEKSFKYFSFIPKGELGKVLSEAEIELTGLRHREDLVILWYLKGGKPVYYCTRDIETKAFKKASCDNGVLEHPIWNCDDLYNCEHVVWAEGMFDCISFLELGYGVAGEITCNLIKKHKQPLLTALRWRTKNHPDWTFTICLDNDAPVKNGARPGNQAAEKIALWLWSEGVDVRWVKHQEATEKVDINYLHQHGLEKQIRDMIDNAKSVSEIINADVKMSLKNMVSMLNYQDYRGASRMLDVMSQQDKNTTITEILKKTHDIPWSWRSVYDDRVKHIFMYDNDVYAIFDPARFGNNQKPYEIFKRTTFIQNMRRFQSNPYLSIRFDNLDVEYRRPTWRVSKDAPMGESTFNLFVPSPLLLQERQSSPCIPPTWDKVMDNLAGELEKEWFLNHLAVYVQTLKKPKTIPVLVGGQGTGKTSLAELFGRGIGGYVAVGNTEMESQFNSYLMSPVVLLDELANSQRDSNKLKNKLKSFINEHQQINEKNHSAFSAELNNYIIIASNEQISHVPLVIERDDRRYSIISGGNNRNLANERWYSYDQFKNELPLFMAYLLSREIDEKQASKPLHNAVKQNLVEMGEDLRVMYVREYVEGLANTMPDATEKMLSQLCDEINEKYTPGVKYTSRSLRPIIEFMGYEVKSKHNQFCAIITPKPDPLKVVSAVESGGMEQGGDISGNSPFSPPFAESDGDTEVDYDPFADVGEAVQFN